MLRLNLRDYFRTGDKFGTLNDEGQIVLGEREAEFLNALVAEVNRGGNVVPTPESGLYLDDDFSGRRIGMLPGPGGPFQAKLRDPGGGGTSPYGFDVVTPVAGNGHWTVGANAFGVATGAYETSGTRGLGGKVVTLYPVDSSTWLFKWHKGGSGSSHTPGYCIQVLDCQGKGLAGCTVTWWPLSGAHNTGGSCTTDSNGYCCFVPTGSASNCYSYDVFPPAYTWKSAGNPTGNITATSQYLDSYFLVQQIGQFAPGLIYDGSPPPLPKCGAWVCNITWCPPNQVPQITDPVGFVGANHAPLNSRFRQVRLLPNNDQNAIGYLGLLPEDVSAKAANFFCTCGCNDPTWWPVYNTLLYPAQTNFGLGLTATDKYGTFRMPPAIINGQLIFQSSIRSVTEQKSSISASKCQQGGGKAIVQYTFDPCKGLTKKVGYCCHTDYTQNPPATTMLLLPGPVFVGTPLSVTAPMPALPCDGRTSVNLTFNFAAPATCTATPGGTVDNSVFADTVTLTATGP